MVFIALYLLTILVGAIASLAMVLVSTNPLIVVYNNIIIGAIVGNVGGIFYCLRSIYINKAVKKQWDKDWTIWYYIRPIVSFIAGAISIVLVKAGLLLLEANMDPNATNIGIYIIAFIAGLNVDNFVKKVEEIGESMWNIGKTRTGKMGE